MKKSLLILACFCLSSCYAIPASDYYFDDVYDEPEYYSQTTYFTPSSSHIYINEQRTYVQPEVVYVKDKPHHHHSSPSHYYYPEHKHNKHSDHNTKHHDKHPDNNVKHLSKHPDNSFKHNDKHSDYRPHSKVPNFYKNEKVTEIKEEKHSHFHNDNKHNGDKHKK